MAPASVVQVDTHYDLALAPPNNKIKGLQSMDVAIVSSGCSSANFSSLALSLQHFRHGETAAVP